MKSIACTYIYTDLYNFVLFNKRELYNSMCYVENFVDHMLITLSNVMLFQSLFETIKLYNAILIFFLYILLQVLNTKKYHIVLVCGLVVKTTGYSDEGPGF